jgi:hypothetical protein
MIGQKQETQCVSDDNSWVGIWLDSTDGGIINFLTRDNVVDKHAGQTSMRVSLTYTLKVNF